MKFNPNFLGATQVEPLFIEPALSALGHMGLHAKMPRIDEQLPILGRLWPEPLVCRWNLNPLHGPYGYKEARKQYEPFDKLIDPDLATRGALAKVIVGTADAGHDVYVTLSNKAEGSAPLSVVELARAVRHVKVSRRKC